MQIMKKIIYTIIVCINLIGAEIYAQDPSFSQFFSSPLNINPALTANINADWRMVMNLRDQWIGPASPYTTGTISYDAKILQKRIPNVEEKNVMGLGGMIMYDYAMSGIAKSAYGSLNLSYNIKLTEGATTQRLGLGFGAIYARKYVDYSRLNFQEQFTGFGFNTNLPTGEAALSNMKPYFSSSAGILYSITTENSNLDIGVSAYHLNKPKQTFLKDPYQFLPMRKVAHANYERIINERVVFNSNAIYQMQSKTSYFSVGGALGYYLGDEDASMITGGLWYWSKNAVIPYVGISYKSLQFGFSYDITTSKLNRADRKPNTWELSVVLKGKKDPTGVIPCPWK
jgi:type IX secretion system PorP/SprF family membrane protein